MDVSTTFLGLSTIQIIFIILMHTVETYFYFYYMLGFQCMSVKYILKTRDLSLVCFPQIMILELSMNIGCTQIMHSLYPASCKLEYKNPTLQCYIRELCFSDK